MSEEIIKLNNISKRFGNNLVLDDVSITCNKGETLIIAGENGAGKSTILKILSGMYAADSGTVIFDGKEVSIKSPSDAQELGIEMVYQELTLVNDLNVLDNIFLNIEICNWFGKINYDAMKLKLSEFLSKYNIDIRPEAFVKDLSVAQQQLVEIVKVLIRDPKVVIFDESTSALGKDDVEKFYNIVKVLVSEGKSVVFISHRLEECFRIGDRVVVLKDGCFVGEKAINEIDEKELIRMMVGRPLQTIFPPKNLPSDDVLFSVRNLSVTDTLYNISFDIHKNEVLGVAGLQGQGQEELFKALYGLIPRSGGQLLFEGVDITPKDSKHAISSGLALVPSDRKNEGLFLRRSITENLGIMNLNNIRKNILFLDLKKEANNVDEMQQRLSIKMDSPKSYVYELSGGNQQKVVLGKELAVNPRVLFFNEPTRGIDVEAKTEFYNIIHDLAMNNVAVLMFSSDLTEIIGMSNRVIVLYEGKITAVLSGNQINEETIVSCAYGAKIEGDA